MADESLSDRECRSASQGESDQALDLATGTASSLSPSEWAASPDTPPTAGH